MAGNRGDVEDLGARALHAADRVVDADQGGVAPADAGDLKDAVLTGRAVVAARSR